MSSLWADIPSYKGFIKEMGLGKRKCSSKITSSLHLHYNVRKKKKCHYRKEEALQEKGMRSIFLKAVDI